MSVRTLSKIAHTRSASCGGFLIERVRAQSAEVKAARSPITSTAAKVSAAAAKQQYQYDDDQDQFHGKSPLMLPALFAAHCILQSADRVLHFARGLVALAFSFQLLVAEDLSSGFFHRAFGLLRRTADSIFIHWRILIVCWVYGNARFDVTFPTARDARAFGLNPQTSRVEQFCTVFTPCRRSSFVALERTYFPPRRHQHLARSIWHEEEDPGP
jgi:hypothetical protein